MYTWLPLCSSPKLFFFIFMKIENKSMYCAKHMQENFVCTQHHTLYTCVCNYMYMYMCVLWEV